MCPEISSTTTQSANIEEMVIEENKQETSSTTHSVNMEEMVCEVDNSEPFTVYNEENEMVNNMLHSAHKLNAYYELTTVYQFEIIYIYILFL